MIEPETIACWKINYGLDVRTPHEAAAWWNETMDGKAPSGAVAALGICLNEIEKLKAENERLKCEYPRMDLLIQLENANNHLKAKLDEILQAQRSRRRRGEMKKTVFCSALMPTSLMENPEARCENCREYYAAEEVDATLKRLTAAAENVIKKTECRAVLSEADLAWLKREVQRTKEVTNG